MSRRFVSVVIKLSHFQNREITQPAAIEDAFCPASKYVVGWPNPVITIIVGFAPFSPSRFLPTAWILHQLHVYYQYRVFLWFMIPNDSNKNITENRKSGARELLNSLLLIYIYWPNVEVDLLQIGKYWAARSYENR